MKYLKLSNPGEIELNAFRLIGASTKRDDTSKIGFFGSGLKYSMAFMLNNNIVFKAYSGVNEIEITTQPLPYRDKTFKVIYINGKETSMTTDMGPDWKPWFVVREIYCNAIDEGGKGYEVVDTITPKEGETAFYILVDSTIDDILKNWSFYFSEGRGDLFYEQGQCKLFNPIKEQLIIYRKGIQCHTDIVNSVFHYDLPWVDINESRVIRSAYSFGDQLVKFFYEQVYSAKVIKHLLDNLYVDEKKYEAGLYWGNSFGTVRRDVWLPAINNRIIVPHEMGGWFQDEIKINPAKYLVLPLMMCDYLERIFGKAVTVLGGQNNGSGRFKKLDPTEKHKFLMKEVLHFFEECGYSVDHKIEIVEFFEDGRLGSVLRADTEDQLGVSEPRILLSERLFDMGRREIAKTIFEEVEHIKTNANDYSRKFQDQLINNVITLMEEKNAYFL